MTVVKNCLEINGRSIGPGYSPYIIAEMSCNHGGDLGKAIELVYAAADSGADAIKLQAYTADTITIDHNSKDFRICGGLWDGYTLYKLYDEAHTPWSWFEKLYSEAENSGIAIFCSPFDNSSVDFLETLDTPAYKIASFESADLPLIEKAAATGKPLIISTGISNLEQITESYEAAVAAGAEQIALLHCVSGYPAPEADINLNVIPDLINRFRIPIGLSDHTLGTAVATGAVVLGASIIEKHLTLSRDDGGPDAVFSMEPEEFKSLVDNCRIAQKACGSVNYNLKPSEGSNVQFRRSLYVVEKIARGEVLTTGNVRSIRPGYGLEPKHLQTVIGKRVNQDLLRGTPLQWEFIDTND